MRTARHGSGKSGQRRGSGRSEARVKADMKWKMRVRLLTPSISLKPDGTYEELVGDPTTWL